MYRRAGARIAYAADWNQAIMLNWLFKASATANAGIMNGVKCTSQQRVRCAYTINNSTLAAVGVLVASHRPTTDQALNHKFIVTTISRCPNVC